MLSNQTLSYTIDYKFIDSYYKNKNLGAKKAKRMTMEDATVLMFSKATHSHHNATISDNEHNHKNTRNNQK